MTSSNGRIFRVTGQFPTQRPGTRSFDVFFFICAWMDGWVNNREAGDFRPHRTHYDVTVMKRSISSLFCARCWLNTVWCQGIWKHSGDQCVFPINARPVYYEYVTVIQKGPNNICVEKRVQHKQSLPWTLFVEYTKITRLWLWCFMNGVTQYVAYHLTQSLTHWSRAKWLPFYRRHIWVHFLVWKLLYCDLISLKFCPNDPIYDKPILVHISNTSAPRRRQTRVLNRQTPITVTS